MDSLDDILRRKRLRANRLNAALGTALGSLRDMGALKAVLFGSVARGEADIGSDLDLLVIMPATKSGREWTRLLYDQVPRDVGIDFLVYNEEEWDRELPISSFLRHIQEHGRVVYEKAVQ